MTLSAIFNAFIVAQGLAPKLNEALDAAAAAEPAIADDVAAVKATIAQAVDSGTFVPAITAGFAGAIGALRAGHGEIGKGTHTHFG